MDIGEVSKRSGVTPSALRYYEEIGLITSSYRIGLRRQYPLSVLEKLALITLAKVAGFTLSEMQTLFRKEGKVLINKDQLKKKATEIDRKIKRMEAVKNGLIHASNCKAPSHLECPTFKKLLRSATKRRQLRDEHS